MASITEAQQVGQRDAPPVGGFKRWFFIKVRRLRLAFVGGAPLTVTLGSLTHMSFILSEQRDIDCTNSFKQYHKYLAASKQSFPQDAFALASSDWYFNFHEHQCPHDAWLESIIVSEASAEEQSGHRITTIRIRLLGAYHDGFIEFFYPSVFRYSLAAPSSTRGLGDWRYDEFRVSINGHLIHEIEWAGFPQEHGSRWIIEASDVEFQWIPK